MRRFMIVAALSLCSLSSCSDGEKQIEQRAHQAGGEQSVGAPATNVEPGAQENAGNAPAPVPAKRGLFGEEVKSYGSFSSNYPPDSLLEYEIPVGGRMLPDKVSFGYILSSEGFHIPHFRTKDGKLMQMSGFTGGPPVEYYLPPDAVIRKKPLEPGSAPLPATVPFDAQVKLPGEPSDVTVGGGGRYLLLSLRDQQSVGVFDVREAKLVKYVNVGMTDFLVAGGATEFVVSSLDGSLAAWKYDALDQPRIKAKLPMQGRFRVQAIALGYSSDGPLGISSAYNITNEHCIELYDLATLESAKIAIDWNGGGWITNLDRFELAATPDGQSFTCLQGTAVSGLDLKGATAVARAEQTLPATPNDNDRWYIGLDGRTVFRRETLVLPDGRTVAASHGAAGQYSLSLPGHVWVASGQQTRGLILPVSFYLRNSSNPLTTIAFGNQGPQSGLAGRAFPSPKRVFYNGIEKTLAILPPGRKELCFKRYDLDEAIAKLDAVVLDVASQSSTTFQPAAKFEHKIEAVSNRGGLTYRLESGPKGMMISSDGRIEWSAPIDAPSVQTAIVTITDRTGKSIFHNLTLERGPTATVEVALTGGAVNPAADRVALRLPAPADDFVVGAGGRYLLAPMNAKRQIAVIDVKERKLVKLLPTDDEVKVAAGATRFVVYTAKGELSRWNFDRLERESAESFAGPVESLCLGSASEGPLLLSVGTPGSCRATFVDLATLKSLKIDIYSSLHGTPDPAIDELTAASADGRTFTSWRKGEGVKGVNSYVVRGDRAEAFKRQESGGAVTPSPDGSTLYTLLGSYPSRQSQAAIDAARRHHVGWPARMSLPAATGNFILSWPSPHETKERDVELFTQGTRTPILKIAGLPRPSMAMNFDDPDPLYSRRLLYVPAADAILSIGPGRESVIIHRFALDDALSKWKPDYLFVTSLPPTEAQPSTQLSYQVVVRSAKGGLKYELPMAPRGASVSPSGLITWDIGPILNTAYDFGVRIVDSAGGETSQVFRVQVGPISNAGSVPVAALPGPGRSGSRPTGRPLPAQPFPDPRGPGADFPVPPGSQPPMVSSPPNVAAAPAAATAVPATARPATTIEFPAPVERLIAGGGGRYLVGFIETLRQIVVVDVVERKVVKYIPVDEEEVLLAVGATRFVALLGKKGTLQRYTLSTGEREQTGAAPSEKIVGLAMGSASEGPIIAVDLVDDPLTKVRLIDLNSLKAANDVKIEPDEIDFDREVAVSADGAFFVKGDSTGRISGSHIQVSELDWRHGSLGNALPSADGRVVYGLGGQYIVGSPSRDQKRLPAYFIPAVVGPLYARIPTPTSRLGDMVPVIGMQGESQPVLRLADLDLNAGETRRNGDVYNSVMAERFFLIPTVDTIAALGPDLNRLKLYRFNIDEEFAKVPDGFLFVASIAPGLVHPTSGMAYQLDVRSKQGGVKYRLDSGPPGMKVSDTGLLTWTAAGPDSSEKVVIVALSDASGKEAFHTFKFKVDATAPKHTAVGMTFRSGPAPAAALATSSTTTAAPAAPAVPQPAAPAPGTAVAIATAPGERALHELKLPSVIDDICVGGGGRYLVVKLNDLRKAAIVDVAAKKIATFVPLDDDRCLIAAGKTKLVVVLQTKNVVHRYDLATGAHELSVPVESGPRNAWTTMVMGSASEGPIVVAQKESYDLWATFLDLQTLKAIKLTGGKQRLGQGPLEFPGNIRISADGRLIGSWNTGLSPSGLNLTAIDGGELKQFRESKTVGMVTPGPDARYVYTGLGIYSPEAKPLTVDASRSYPSEVLLPAASGPLYLRIVVGAQEDRSKSSLRLGVHGDAAPLFKFSDVMLPPVQPMLRRVVVSELALDQQYFLLPAADTLAVAPRPGDKLLLYRFELDEDLRRSQVDYLFVASTPPAAVRPGVQLRYQMEGKSSRGEVKYRLEAGPVGLTVSPTGLVEWKAVRGAGPDEAVTVALSDASGQEVSHTFQLRVDSAAPTASPKPSAATPPGVIRTWRSSDGKFTAEAKFAGKADGKVTLVLPDGKRIEVALDKLSAEDQDYIRSIH